MKKLTIITLLLIVTGTSLQAQPNSDRLKSIEASLPMLDKIFKDYSDKNHFPGMVYGLVVDGKLIHTFNTGYTEIEKKTPVSPQSCFRIASMTKSFTAMAILKLRDEGKLSLDDPAYKYIPELKNQKYPTSDAAPITVRHLLSHAAGFPEDNPWGDRQLAITDEKMIQMIRKGISFSNDPGLAYEYSNMGFAMLGYIIKKVSGQTYQKYIKDNIWIPLGMTHTYWDYSDIPPDQLANGYRWLNDTWVKQPMLKDGAYGAMGGVITSMEDFGKYTAFHLSVWPPSDAKESGSIRRSSVREMQHPWNVPSLNAQNKTASGRACPTTRAYSFGLAWTLDCDGIVKVGHSGGLPGFGSNWTILPDYGIGIISFANLTYASMSNINVQVLDTLISLNNLRPRLVSVSPILNQRKNELIKLLPDWKDAPSTGIFAVNFFLDYFPDSLRKEASAIFEKAGKIVSVREFVALNNLRGSFIMEGEHSNVEVSFTLSPETPALIQEYHIKEVKK